MTCKHTYISDPIVVYKLKCLVYLLMCIANVSLQGRIRYHDSYPATLRCKCRSSNLPVKECIGSATLLSTAWRPYINYVGSESGGRGLGEITKYYKGDGGCSEKLRVFMFSLNVRPVNLDFDSPLSDNNFPARRTVTTIF